MEGGLPLDADKLGTAVQQAGIIGILLVFLVGAATKKVVFWWQYDDLLKDRDAARRERDELRLRLDRTAADRDDWKAVALSARDVARDGESVANRASTTTAALVAHLERADAELRQRGRSP